jgi:hypothetical protein
MFDQPGLSGHAAEHGRNALHAAQRGKPCRAQQLARKIRAALDR